MSVAVVCCKVPTAFARECKSPGGCTVRQSEVQADCQVLGASNNLIVPSNVRSQRPFWALSLPFKPPAVPPCCCSSAPAFAAMSESGCKVASRALATPPGAVSLPSLPRRRRRRRFERPSGRVSCPVPPSQFVDPPKWAMAAPTGHHQSLSPFPSLARGPMEAMALANGHWMLQGSPGSLRAQNPGDPAPNSRLSLHFQMPVGIPPWCSDEGLTPSICNR